MNYFFVIIVVNTKNDVWIRAVKLTALFINSPIGLTDPQHPVLEALTISMGETSLFSVV